MEYKKQRTTFFGRSIAAKAASLIALMLAFVFCVPEVSYLPGIDGTVEVEAAVKKVIEAKGRCGNYVFQTAEGAREVKDLNALYAVVKDYLTPQEFNAVCKITLGKFEAALSETLIAEAAAKGEKLTKTEAKSRCYSMISSLITRGNPTKKIVEEVA